MKQYSIIRYCYDTVFEILKKAGENSKLYSVTNNIIGRNEQAAETIVFIEVPDLTQISQDKNGEKIFIKEANLPEQQFPAPTHVAFIFSIAIMARYYHDVLETAGYIIRYFKDNNIFEAGKYNWHGNTSNSIYIEPIIREPEIHQILNQESMPFVSLEYRIEAAINSEKGETIKRVQSREIKAMNK